MNKNSSHAFVNQLLMYPLVMVCCSGSIGLGTVWLRYQISVTANRNKLLETRIAEVERHLAETTTAIETEQGPATLMRRNTEWRLGLVQPSEAKVSHVTEAVDLRLATKHNQELFADHSVPPVVHFGARDDPRRLADAGVTPVGFRLGRTR